MYLAPGPWLLTFEISSGEDTSILKHRSYKNTFTSSRKKSQPSPFNWSVIGSTVYRTCYICNTVQKKASPFIL